jgi:iron complex outermembrane receptor protein
MHKENKFMSKFFTLFLFVLTTAFAQAQRISGVVKDESGKAINGASVSLLKENSTVVVKLTVSDNEGKFSFPNIAAGKYFILVSNVGFTDAKSAVFEAGSDVAVPEFKLKKAAKNIDGVTVTARKPMIEVKADKTILNVENTINAAGSDALELLRKAPGVTIDKDDAISLAGKNGVQIYIDGRPSPLAGKDLTDFLKTVQSSQIEAIEIITNPSAKYDAAGNAGIINIRLKKNKAYGTNGSVNAGYAIGTYGKYNAGINLNNRNDKLNLFGSYNFSHNLNENKMNLYRKQLDTLFDQKGVITNKNTNHAFKAGLDYFIDKKNTFGLMVTGSLNDNETNNYSRTPISYIPTNTGYRVLIADNTQDGGRDNVNLNLNYRFADTSGRELNLDGNYGYYNNNSDQYQPNVYKNYSETTILESKIYRMLSPGKIYIANLKADYEQNMNKGRLGYGAKISFVNSNPDFKRYDVSSTTGVNYYDSLRSNKFDYKENINAAYVNYNKQYKGFMIQVGLRVENTHAKGKSNGFKQVGASKVTYDSTFDRNYTDFFPSAAITINKNPMSQWSFTYSRRIDRPAYQDLNPFEFKLDEYTYQKGNTQLTPQYTNSFGITNTIGYKLNIALNYSHVKDIFAQLIDTAEKSKSFITKKNLATQDVVSLNISYPYQWKWYSLFFNVTSNYSHYKADFGGGNRKVDLDAFAYNIFTQHTFKLGKGYTAELSGWYNSPTIWQGTFESKGMGSVDAGLQKVILKGMGNLKFSVSDIFKTLRWSGENNFAGQYLRASGNWESRQFKVNFSYRFGKLTVKSARQRKTGVEEEGSRTQGGGGIGGN